MSEPIGIPGTELQTEFLVQMLQLGPVKPSLQAQSVVLRFGLAMGDIAIDPQVTSPQS
jgi:hypothetical protein